jgi:DNA-binding response OmpR family regulator
MPKKILVLDDDHDLLEMMEIVLSAEGYTVFTRNNGDDITTHIANFKPDLILMDVMLAGLDGRDLCRNIKADKLLTAPVILISGTHNLAQVMKMEGAPDDFIAKPFDIDDLLSKVKVQLSKNILSH